MLTYWQRASAYARSLVHAKVLLPFAIALVAFVVDMLIKPLGDAIVGGVTFLQMHREEYHPFSSALFSSINATVGALANAVAYRGGGSGIVGE